MTMIQNTNEQGVHERYYRVSKKDTENLIPRVIILIIMQYTVGMSSTFSVGLHQQTICDVIKQNGSEVGSDMLLVSNVLSHLHYNVNVNVKPCTCRKYIINVIRSYELYMYNVNPNTVGVQKCLISNSIDHV